ncbi:probable 6-phosphogluconolactonase 4, chloroplastic [Olea europaea subsp. europaea]|uniref:Probable 6-phosphogluconolactonase 4, chloroplastic n=1 Tax=Olea europaea subsp. europaea TaxID=158383 RepID=A0A8S0U4U8_OLEEU|nr:probable 6-phosphogluconolactonase 4, chloroplastic [Olea europaea subsp. europaea]
MALDTPVKSKTNVLKFHSEEDVAVALAKYTADLSKKHIREKGSFSVVLSGGTLIDTMRKMVESPYKDSVDWSKWLIFWVDDRVVPLDSDDSNYKLAWDGFLSKVPISPSNTYAINDKLTPEDAADDYEARLKHLVDSKIILLSDASGFPKFDLMLLGMEPDGHRWVTFITDYPKPPPPRITFTFTVINSASEIAMVVTGAELADTVKKALGGGLAPGSAPLPCMEVSPEGELTWFLEKDAASKL